MRNIFSKSKYSIKHQQKGMTLIELLVVLGIFSVITGLVMFDYGSFKSTTSTQNLANDIALSVRKAQSSAIGVRGVNATFKYGHGIHFTNNEDKSNLKAGSFKSFILFADIDSGKYYDYDNNNSISCGSTGIECEEVITINGIDEISTIFLEEIPQSSPDGMLDIVFRRPDPDAIFCYRSNVNSTCSTEFSYVKIEISNGQENEDRISRMITIWNTGQISVK